MELLNSPSRKLKKQEIRSVVVFDTESTGLPSPGNNPRITELCFLASTREELLTRQNDLRVVNKLQLCFNPRKMICSRSSEITGLFNDSLSLMAEFKVQVPVIIEFLRTLPQPTCLVAHNGNGFDFPLLVAELKQAKDQLPPTILCADSLEALRTFDGFCPVPDYVLKKRAENKKAAHRLPENHEADEVSRVSDSNATAECVKPKRKPDFVHETENGLKQQKFSEHWESLELGTPTKGKAEKKEPYVRMKQESKTSSKCIGFATVNIGSLESARRRLFDQKDESHLSETGGESSDNQNAHSSSSQDLFDVLTDSEKEMILEVERVESSVQKEDVVSRQEKILNNSRDSLCKPVKEQLSKPGQSDSVKEGPPPKTSYSLGKVYSRIFGQQPEVSHTAEDDCRTLLKIISCKADSFLNWLEDQAVPLRETEMVGGENLKLPCHKEDVR